MKKDKVKNYILETIILVILFFALFVPNIFTKIILAIILTIYMITTRKVLLKRNILSIYHKQTTMLMLLLGILYLMVFYLIGLYTGYYQATVKFSSWSIINYIIPISVIIISSEIIRSIFLTEKNIISKILTTISMILIELILYTNISQITSFETLVNTISFTIFASISCNLLYNYISVRYGSKPIIVFRLITIIYSYLIPIIPDIHILFRCFLRIFYPYITYLMLEKCFSRDNFEIVDINNKRSNITTIILIIIMILIIMLVSCEFKYGILAIGSGSMSGAINKGDTVIFEAYDEQTISEGEVIIFKKNNINMVHRVVEIRKVNGDTLYYTKGDANQQIDEGYITNNDIIGITKFRVVFVGYPAILLREIFTKT